MAEYDAFKRLCDLSGAGWCSATNSPTLDEEGWTALAQAQPRNAGLYKRFRTEGFAHTNICALLAGDSRATAEDAETVGHFDASSLLEDLPVNTTNVNTSNGDASAIVESSACDSSSEDQSQPDITPHTPFSPPSAAQRTRRVKRYRDGRKKSKDAEASDDAKASVASFMRTAEAYFQMKMKLLVRELDAEVDYDVAAQTTDDV